MSIRREAAVAGRLRRLILEHPGPSPGATGPMDAPLLPGSPLTRRGALALFEAGLQSRLQDLEARRLKEQGLGYYTIGSSGHEANAVFGHLLRTTDPCLLHYRSGAFMAARARHGRGETPIFDAMLAFTASAEDPVAGGRHKVFGSPTLMVPPQTSTIASHLPKAVGFAYALGRMRRLGTQAAVPWDSIVYCSFGDASVNHATAQAGFNAAVAARLHSQPCPILFACEDNGLGISVRTPRDYVQRCFRHRAGLDYYQADGRDLPGTYAQAMAAIEHCRRTRRPVFFHLRAVRLLGHAGTDIESGYLSARDIEASEELDPLLAMADLLLRAGAIDQDGLLALHRDLSERIERAGREAARRPKLASARQVMEPLSLPPSAFAADGLEVPVAPADERRRVFGDSLPEDDPRPRHLAFRLAQGLKDLMAAVPEMVVLGEDVARKGGVYHVTDGLHPAFGSGRVFNTILDETTILGVAQGMAQAGCLPFPEIQYLAYVHNAIDQLRGEAASLQFFSAGRFSNPMVVRVAGYAYQKGFGGHFHNDNAVGALLEIPGLVIASPSRGDDAVMMLRTCAALARGHGKVCVFLEPIALYMARDLHEAGDGAWQFPYPEPSARVPLGEPRVYDPRRDDRLTIVTCGNGVPLSLRAQRRLRAEGIGARVVDLRWLLPLPVEAVVEQVRATGRALVVDECRRTGGGPSALLVAALAEEPSLRGAHLRRIAAEDSYVPLGPAADLVLVQVDDVVAAARELAAREGP